MPAVLVDLGGTYLRLGLWREYREPEILPTSNIPRPLKARQQVQVLVESWGEYSVGL